MSEIELKFQVPVAKRPALQRALATARAQIVPMQAKYFDTADQRLAAARITLRLRKEGRQWVQTLKCPGENRWSRLEHEVPRETPKSGDPELDPALHAGTPGGAVLATALGDGAGGLKLRFETDVQRTRRVIRHQGTAVEVALDIGEIRAGSERMPLHEIEFELKTGTVAGLTALAKRWVERHGLWLDMVTKPERGERLAQGEKTILPVQAHVVELKDAHSPDAALRKMVGACLAHLLPNAAEVAGEVAAEMVDGAAQPEHLHQVRVSLRRLRTALRIYGDWSQETDAAWNPALATLFGQLGSARDRDALEAGLLPQLRAVGAPLAELPAEEEGVAVVETLRAPATTGLWLELIAFANGTPQDASAQTAATDLRVSAAAKLKHLQRQLAKDAKNYPTFDDTGRHRARRRLKRLRYSLEFVSSLFSKKKVKAYAAKLKPAQDALGEYTDLVVAEQAFTRLLSTQPQAWFALGWLAARRPALLAAAQSRLQKWAKKTVFW